MIGDFVTYKTVPKYKSLIFYIQYTDFSTYALPLPQKDDSHTRVSNLSWPQLQKSHMPPEFFPDFEKVNIQILVL